MSPDEQAGPASAAPQASLGGALLEEVRRQVESPQTAAILQRIVASAESLAEAEGAAILLYDREAGLFRLATPRLAVGLDRIWLRRRGLDAARALSLRAVEARDIVEVRDTATTPELDIPLLAGRRRPGAVASVPLEVDSAVVGVLEVYFAQPRFAALPRSVLRPFAELVGLTIAVALAHERERALLVRLEAMEAASRALAAEHTPDGVLQRIVDVATQVAGARYGALGVAGPDGYLTTFITSGISVEERARIGPLPRGHGLLGELIREGRPLRVPNISQDPRRVGFPPYHPPMTSLLGVPIRMREDVVGDLYLTNKIGAPAFSEEDQHLIELLVVHAAVAIENARLYTQAREVTMLREREHQARALHDNIIQEIYAAILRIESLAPDVPAGARMQLHRIASTLGDVIHDVRGFIEGLQARDRERRLLGDGLAALVQEVNAQAHLLATYAVDGPVYSLPEPVVAVLLHIARAALTRAAARAGATQAHIGVSYRPAAVVLTITDNAQGVNVATSQEAEQLELQELRARAAEVGGTISVTSRPGVGTTIQMSVPAPDTT